MIQIKLINHSKGNMEQYHEQISLRLEEDEATKVLHIQVSSATIEEKRNTLLN